MENIFKFLIYTAYTFCGTFMNVYTSMRWVTCESLQKVFPNLYFVAPYYLDKISSDLSMFLYPWICVKPI